MRAAGRGLAGAPADGATGHFGLTGMRERAQSLGGSLTVESRAEEGTKVRLEVPLGKEIAGRTKV
jgi:signal transduction histidine kinase